LLQGQEWVLQQTDEADVLLLQPADAVGLEQLCGAPGWLPAVHVVCQQLLAARRREPRPFSPENRTLLLFN
jgi:hypothetical protein